MGKDTMPDDAELLRRYVDAGSEDAFCQLVSRHVNLVYSAALRRVGGDAHLAKDVVQHVFIALARRAPALLDRPLLAGWLYTTSRFVSSRLVRDERRRRERETAAHIMNEEPDPNPNWDLLRPVLDDAMDHLGTGDREALLMRYFEGRPYSDVSARLGLTNEAARKRVDRAVGRLRKLLAKRGIASTGTAVAALMEANAVAAAPSSLAALVSGTAVASKGGATATALKVFYSMTKTKLSVGLTAIVAAVAVGTAVFEVNSSVHYRRLLNEASLGNRALRKELADVERGEHASELARDAADRALMAAKISQAAADGQLAKASGSSGAVARDPKATGRELIASQPILAEDVASYFTARVTYRYDALFKSLGLTSGQIQKFVDISVQGTAGVNWASATQSPVGALGVGSLSHSEMESELQDLLGAAGYAQYQQYNGNGPSRQLASQLGGALYQTPAPLTAEQGAQMTAIFTSSGMGAGSPNWNAATTKASAVLSDSQVGALGALQQQVQYQQALDQAINQSMAQAVSQAKQHAGIGAPPAAIAP